MKIKMFNESADYRRGRQLDKETMESAEENKLLTKLGKLLREAARRPSSRVNYNTWFRTWLQFCKQKHYDPMPAEPERLPNFMTMLAMHYSISSVQMAVAAVIA